MASRKPTQREEAPSIETLRVSVVRERSPLTYRLAGPVDAAKTARELIGDDLDREVFGRYCQVEGVETDPTPRCGQQSRLEPHYVGPVPRLSAPT